jgi:hypothetical protein
MVPSDGTEGSERRLLAQLPQVLEGHDKKNPYCPKFIYRQVPPKPPHPNVETYKFGASSSMLGSLGASCRNSSCNNRVEERV